MHLALKVIGKKDKMVMYLFIYTLNSTDGNIKNSYLPFAHRYGRLFSFINSYEDVFTSIIRSPGKFYNIKSV